MQDIRLAFRSLRAAPVVTAVAVLSLALGIGANTAIFSIVDSLLLRSLPVREPAQLVLVAQAGQRAMSTWTNPIWEQIRDRESTIFAGAAAWGDVRFDLAQGGQAAYVNGLWTSGAFFDVLGVPAILGRTLTRADDRRGGGPDGPVAVISYAFWQSRFGGAADAVGRTIALDRVAFTIVGVTPPAFTGPTAGRAFDVAAPLADEPIVRGARSLLDRRSVWWLEIIARLRPGQTLDAARGALRGVQPRIREATIPEHWRAEAVTRYLVDPIDLTPASTGPSFLRQQYRQPLLAIMVVVALVLLIACANVANLLLARATGRRHELSVRIALGASRLRLARQLLTETLLLAALGGAIGLLFAEWASRLLVNQLSSSGRPVFLDLTLDWRVLAFTAAVAIGTAAVFGTWPAFRATKVEPIEALKAQGRGFAGDGGRGLSSPLVVLQVALSLVLVVAAGLFVRTFTRLAHLNPGFEPHGVMVVSLDAGHTGAKGDALTAEFVRAAESVAAVPGVSHAAASSITPVSRTLWNESFEFPDKPSLTEEDRTVNVNAVTPGWFATCGTKLVAGRDVSQADRAGAPAVAIVNEAFARKFFDGANPVGRTIKKIYLSGKPSPPIEIVGLVESAVYESLREAPPPTVYLPLPQAGDLPPFASISLRAASGSPAPLTRSVAAAIGRVDPDLALTFTPLATQIDESLTQERLVAMLSGFFGALALLLAGIGLYGVTSYAVTRRVGEIGIRLALGAGARDVLALVLVRVFTLVGLGVAIGVAASVFAARFVGSLVYGLPPRDPLTLAGAAAVLAAIGAIAGWLPARRAARIDPAAVLRDA